MADIIQLRRGTAAQWAAANPILADGETGLEKDTRQIKVGDGVTPWNSLAYYLTGPSGVGASFPFTNSTQWVVVHNKATKPSVTCVNALGEQIFAEVKYISNNEVHIFHQNPQSGSAYIV